MCRRAAVVVGSMLLACETGEAPAKRETKAVDSSRAQLADGPFLKTSAEAILAQPPGAHVGARLSIEGWVTVEQSTCSGALGGKGCLTCVWTAFMTAGPREAGTPHPAREDTIQTDVAISGSSCDAPDTAGKITPGWARVRGVMSAPRHLRVEASEPR